MSAIIKNNKIIAKFIGIEIEKGQELIYFDGLGTELIEYTFNSDWNWLMVVVQKIESLSYKVSIINNECYIEAKDETNPFLLISCYSNTKIESTYNICLKFIKQYV